MINTYFIRIVMAFIPAYASFYFLIITPVNIFLDRDLQYNGKIVTGNVTEYKMLKGKRDNLYREIKVEYILDDKKYSKWFNNENLEVGKSIEINYSPIYPSHSILLRDKNIQYSWDKNILFRLLIISFLGLTFGAIAIGMIKSKDSKI